MKWWKLFQLRKTFRLFAAQSSQPNLSSAKFWKNQLIVDVLVTKAEPACYEKLTIRAKCTGCSNEKLIEWL